MTRNQIDKVQANATLTIEQVIEIKNALKTTSISKIARRYKLPYNKVWGISTGMTYSLVGEKI